MYVRSRCRSDLVRVKGGLRASNGASIRRNRSMDTALVYPLMASAAFPNISATCVLGREVYQRQWARSRGKQHVTLVLEGNMLSCTYATTPSYMQGRLKYYFNRIRHLCTIYMHENNISIQRDLPRYHKDPKLLAC
jgi:hypothetical protein